MHRAASTVIIVRIAAPGGRYASGAYGMRRRSTPSGGYSGSEGARGSENQLYPVGIVGRIAPILDGIDRQFFRGSGGVVVLVAVVAGDAYR